MDKFNSWLSSPQHNRNLTELSKILKLLSKSYITRSCFFYVEYCYSHKQLPDDECIQMMIDHGADPEYKDLLYNKKPLTLAFENGEPDTIDVLVRNGADLFYLDKNKDTYLTIALSSFRNISDESVTRIVSNYKYKYTHLMIKNNFGVNTLDEIVSAYPQDSREYALIYDALKYDFDDTIVKECMKIISEETGMSVREIQKILEKEID
jgi:hypothetical protein